MRNFMMWASIAAMTAAMLLCATLAIMEVR